MLWLAERLGEPAGTESFDFVECRPRSGRNQHDVIVDARAVAELDLVRFRMQASRAGGPERDALALERARQIELRALGRAVPGTAACYLKIRLLADDGDLITIPRDLG